MRFDGDRMQLMVQGEDVRVRSVDTAKEGNVEGNVRTLTIVALISVQQEKALAKAWNDSFDEPITAAFNGGKVHDARESELRKRNKELKEEIHAVRRQLAEQTLRRVEDLPSLD